MALRKITLLLAIVSVIGITGCDLAKNYTKLDREGNLESQDYRDLFAPRAPDAPDEMAEDNIPPLMPYVAGVSDNLKPMPLVSVNLNQSVPLRDALFELTKEAGYDLELDPNIRGSIIFTANNRPFDAVIERIADVAGLRYQFVEETLRIELDTPYSKSYKIDFLNIIRTSSSNVSNDISVVSGDGADTGSNFTADTTSESDFWSELEGGMSQILNVAGAYNNLRTARDPRLNVTDPTPVPVEQAGTAGSEGEENLNANTGAPVEPEGPPQAVLEIESLPLDEEEFGRNNNDSEEPAISFSINKQAGLVMVYAPQKQHDQVREYLDLVRKMTTSQVLIEAKVLEVSLEDEFASGIDWTDIDLIGGDVILGSQSGNFTGGFLDGFTRQVLPIEPSPTTNFRLGVAGNDVQAVFDAVSRFGTVKALASPRLTVLNNQSAVLNVATNVVYFEIEIDQTDGNDNTQGRTEIESEIKTVPEGVLINVQPSINLDNGTISMSLRPTITTVESFVEDPGVAFVASAAGVNISSRVPQVNVQEIDSVINLRSGEAVIMGGLMQDRVETNQAGVPGLRELPLAGALFRNQGDNITKTELVIFLKATILDGQSGIHQTDRELYRKFSGDRRPFRM